MIPAPLSYCWWLENHRPASQKFVRTFEPEPHPSTQLHPCGLQAVQESRSRESRKCSPKIETPVWQERYRAKVVRNQKIRCQKQARWQRKPARGGMAKGA